MEVLTSAMQVPVVDTLVMGRVGNDLAIGLCFVWLFVIVVFNWKYLIVEILVHFFVYECVRRFLQTDHFLFVLVEHFVP